MTRKAKTVRNLAVTAALLLAWSWCSNWYLDPARCVSDSLRQLYFMPHEVLLYVEGEPGERIYLAAGEDNTIAVHRTQRHFGIFWSPGSGGTGIQVRTDAPLFVTSGSRGERCYAVFYRVDPAIASVQVTADGAGYETAEWAQDFAMLAWTGSSRDAVYRAYDRDGQLVYETE